ncbi:hypothetical protein MY3296_008783 [Beauveria thailandica]
MSLSEGIAAKLSPADSDPSPPTSPRLAKTVDEPPSPSPAGLSATKAKTSSTAIGSVVSTDSRERVPHSHRVERLVHAELMERRVRHYYERCTAQHVEWFEAEVDEAAAVMDKWSRWMRTRPEQRRMTRQNVTWYLKEAEKKRLADVSLFLKHLEGTS